MNQKSSFRHRGILSVSEDAKFIFVEGETFKYGFSKSTGLISSLKVLDNDFLQGTGSEIPDIYVSDAQFSEEALYAARYESEAECEILSANPHEVHIRTHGVYHDLMGKAFPARYRITYEIENDGTIFVIVDNKATDSCTIRWLCTSKGLLNSSLCSYFSHLEDQSTVDTTGNYIFKEIPSQRTSDVVLFNGKLIPWCWFGNDTTGVEISVWDIGYQRYGTTFLADKTNEQAFEAGVDISAIAETDGVSWEIMSFKDTPMKVNSGWEYTSYFALSVMPPKHYEPALSSPSVYYNDPRQYKSTYLSDKEIEEIANKGFNLIVLAINGPGKFMPYDESEVKRVISISHKYGMKVVPHISMMETSRELDIFDTYSIEWQIEPSNNNDNSTALMCPGAEGWREYWKEQVDKIIKGYDFDGVYLDLFYDRLACRNPLHGCQRRYMRPTFLWVREMIRHAWLKAKSKKSDSIIILSTDLLPMSMICSWVDARCTGNPEDTRNIGKITEKLFFSSQRLGCNSITCVDQAQKND